MEIERDALGRRKARRVKQYGRPVPVGLRPDVLAEVEAVADRWGLSLAEVIRRCVEGHLPRLRDSLRKRRSG